MDEEQIVPTIDVEWDSTFFGGDYDRISSSTMQVPVDFVGRFSSEEEAFERFTHIHRCHIISIAPEESEAYGHEKDQAGVEAEQGYMLAFADAHAPLCAPCEGLAQQIRKEEEHEQTPSEWYYDLTCRCRLCRSFEMSLELDGAIMQYRREVTEKPQMIDQLLGPKGE